MKIAESIDLFLSHCRYEKNLNDKTIEAYKTDLLQFDVFLKTQKVTSIHKVDKQSIKLFVQHLAKFEVRTIKRKIASSKAYLNFLEFEDYILVNPYRKVKLRIKEPRQLPVVLELEEVKRLFQVLKSECERAKDKSFFLYGEKLRDLSILELLFATGIRVSELCGLRIEDINLETGSLLVHGKGNKERIIQICNSETTKILKDYYRLYTARIKTVGYFLVSRLGTPLSQQSVRFLISKYCKLAGIRKNVTPHTFRHTFATLLLEQDVDIKYIQHFLGHSSINTTQIYTHVNKKKQLEILSTKHPRHLFVLG